MRPLFAALAIGLVAFPALADECVYGSVPSLKIVGDRDALEVDFGDWTEVCALSYAEPRPDMGFGTGYLRSWIATCENWSAQVAFVAPDEGGEQTIVVFDGNVFYRHPNCTDEINLGL